MGSEHSALRHQQQQQPPASSQGGTLDGGALRTGSLHRHPPNPGQLSTACRSGSMASAAAGGGKLQRGNTIAESGVAFGVPHETDSYGLPSAVPSSAYICDSRPVSPPMSVCSDSDLPYISYTDKPIGDSPKLRNKQQGKQVKTPRPNSAIVMNRSGAAQSSQPEHTDVGERGRVRPATSGTHSIVVVKSATVRDVSIEKDDDIVRLQSVPMFLPVMRGTLTLPANRDPEVLERLQPAHLINMCSRLQSHFNTCALQVSSKQQQITNKIKEVDQEVSSALAQLVQKQKLYTSYAETFSKVRQVSQQLTRCNDILNQNIENMEYLNNLLAVDERLEPFMWKTE
ncbi:BLOC-1-related complex subunit 5 [Anopheles bellator]|uniref:BLOC-1-related complex subunit 5 n=1 Tax=Anopheles bellator TaxID=139047 RepID=UPI0026475695|nr:BLOC-1-related complex subunit 5 [Anopheles bellator]XP_058064352.1 BLOC-1-related complex subunit 5 [Anopheles bellator]XP_058064354.1 BLOC-1-related complex subunit 5 [Anopheles bellator]XP_058064355.1 BLOC-1-related complex subunit 5 [Anopheles bellator]XP_058064356.1 BLOC-1-related complex subunit 5 [Anopheles bellator]